MRINNNIMAMNTNRQLGTVQTSQAKSMEKLSSGYRINRAADDAAGLSISETMRSQIKGLDQATRNAQDGISLIQTAEGALTEVNDMFSRLKELSVQAATGTYSDTDKVNIGAEMQELGTAVNEILTTTEFNGIDVFGAATDIAYGDDASLTVTVAAATTTAFTALKAETDAASTSAADAEAVTVALVEAAIAEVSTQRATYGAQQNKLEHVINSQNTTSENVSAAESRIRDVDMATEMMEFTKNNVLSQAATSMLAQANQQPQSVLQLLN